VAISKGGQRKDREKERTINDKPYTTTDMHHPTKKKMT
jgi:hypothetical protein